MTLGDKLRARATANANGVVPVKPVSEIVARAEAMAHPENKLAFRKAFTTEKDAKFQEYAEVARVTGLPLVERMTESELEEFNRTHILASAFETPDPATGKPWRLFTEQAEGAAAYEMADGGFFPIGVGRGKTLLILLIASIAYSKGLRRMAVSIPPNIFEQFVDTDIKWARTKIPMPYSIHILAGKSADARGLLAKSGKKGLYVFTHSLLSTKDASDLLFAVDPQILLIDEAHHFANDTAARTKRVGRFLEDRKPEFVPLSGTMTKKTVQDYWHLAHSALKQNNPLPNSKSLAYEWGSIIDANAASGAGGPLVPLIDWARNRFPDARKEMALDDQAAFRKAFNLRLTTAPGVVSSSDSEIGTTLILSNRPIENYEQHKDWNRLNELIVDVEDAWLTPNGDEIDHAIHTWKCLYELTAGFYNELTWPEPSVLAHRKTISLDAATEIIFKSQVYHSASQEYTKMLRKWLECSARQGLDTPFLVGSDMVRNEAKNVGSELFETWKEWKATDFDGRIDRDSKAVRVCSYKIDAAVQWAQSIEGGAIMWVYHQEVGQWLYESLKAVGVDALHCPAGPRHNTAILDHGNKNRVMVASMTAHGTGKNLQHFSQQYFVQWPRPASDAEQTIGRTHRSGQTAGELIVWRNDTTYFDRLNFAACLNDALYIHQTMRSRQKIVYCNYDPLPEIFPSAVLRERGFDATVLTSAELALIQQRFGKPKA